MKKTIAITLALVVSVIAFAKPDLPVPKKADKYQYPDLNMESNWGKVTMSRVSGEMTIEGHPVWDAEARFVTPDKVYVWWTLKENGRPAPGIYTVQKDGSLLGYWGYDSDVVIDEKTWEISGDVRGDRIYPTAK